MASEHLYSMSYQQSFDVSISSISGAGEATQEQLDALRAELAERDATLEEERLSWQQERAGQLQEMASLKDKLNVSEVCVVCMLTSSLCSYCR